MAVAAVMSPRLENVTCARLPIASLAFLSEMRCHPDVTVASDGDFVWLRWRPGDDDVLRQVLAIPDVEMLEQRDGLWHRLGHRLPALVNPDLFPATPLFQVLIPAPVAMSPALPWEGLSVRVTLVGHERLEATTALRCHLGALAQWAETAPTAQLTALQAVHWRFETLVRGRNLPAIAGSERFWGRRLLIPLGQRPDPPLPESALCEALGLRDDEIALLFADGIDVIPNRLFRPLTRSAVRIGLMGFR
jgi:hypothetical protein